MYVCICNAITEHEIRNLARNGVRDVDRVHEACNCEPVCLICAELIQEILDEETVGADQNALSRQ